MTKYIYIGTEVIMNKKVKIYRKQNSKKLYCKKKTKGKNKYKMISIKNYKKYMKKKMKGGVPSSKKKRNNKKKTFNPTAVKEKIREKLATQEIIFKPKFDKKILSKVPNKSAFNMDHGRFMQGVSVVRFGIPKVRIFKGDRLRRQTGTNFLVYSR